MWLAIDTATDVGSVALGDPGEPPVGQATLGPRTHARALAPAIAALLTEHGVDWTALEGIAIADGPGSFTGLRIGWGVTKGVAAVHDHLQIRTTPSLLAAAWLAADFLSVGQVAALYDALRGEVFAAVYDFAQRPPAAIVEPALTTIGSLALLPGPDAVVWDSAALDRAALQEWSGSDPVNLWAVDGGAASALLRAVAAGATTLVTDVEPFEPTYGRKAAAQVRWEAQHGRALPNT